MRKRTAAYMLIGVVAVIALTIFVASRYAKHESATVPAYWPTNGWQSSTPEAQGIDSEKLTEVLDVIKNQSIPINSLLVIRNGAVVLDAYFYNPYSGKYPHDMASVTKSVMTTLIGIAAGQGKINLDQTLISFFPERTIANLDSRKEHITVRHLAGMVNGFESGCLADDLGTLQRMRAIKDWIQNSLDRKMVQEPGKYFCYDSPGMHLLSAILQESTGQTALEFAQQYLFGPLGIQDVYWESDLQGRTNGYGDLHIKPLDAAKIGYLFLNKGVWDGVQIVPADWVAQATTPHVKAGDDQYGYGWWIAESSYGARGRGGQNIFVVPSLNAIVVTTGAGFEYDLIDPYLSASVIDPNKPLPPNPKGEETLKDALEAFIQPPPALPASATPNAAQEISGKTYLMDSNLLGIDALTMEFVDPKEASIFIKHEGGDIVLRIGLDNDYRQSTDGSLLRGYWEDSYTFTIEKFDVGLSTIQLKLTSDLIDVDVLGMKLPGHLGTP